MNNDKRYFPPRTVHNGDYECYPKINPIKVDCFAQYYAEKIVPKDNWAIISISDPETRNNVKLNKNWKYKLDINCHDVTEDYNGSFTLFNKNMAKDIIKFVNEDIKDKRVEKLLIHCFAGVSRSVAIAKFLYSYSIENNTFEFSEKLLCYNNYNIHIYNTLVTTFVCGEE